MLNHVGRAAAAARRRRRSADGDGARRPADRRSDGAPSTCVEFRLEDGLPVWRYRRRRHRAREAAAACRTARTRCTSPIGCCAAAGPVRLDLRPSLHFRRHDAPVEQPLAAPVHAHGRRRPLRAVGRGDLPPLRLLIARRRRRRSRSSRDASRQVLYRIERDPRLRVGGRPVEPRLLPRRRSTPDEPATLDRVDRAVGHDAAR